MTVQTYLFFDGCCEEAIRFYGEVFGAELVYLLRFKDGPAEFVVPGMEDKVFHATVTFGETTLNMSDVADPAEAAFGGFALIVRMDEIETAERAFQQLAETGNVRVPIREAFWAKRYGIVKDRFGVTWKLQVH